MVRRRIDFCCKSVGLACFAFCIGMAAGLLLPIYITAVLETVMILLMGYLCLFKW